MCLLVDKLMICVLVIHAVGGCCLHHEHLEPAVHHSVDAGGLHHPGQGPGDACPPGSENPEVPCHDRSCDLAAPGKSGPEELRITWQLSAVTTPPQSAAVLVISRTHIDPQHRLASPAGVRLHLMNQVFLI